MTAKISELIRHFFIYGFGSIIQALTSFILLPIITRHLSVSDYGVYVLINMIGLIAGTIFYFGITSALPRSYFDYSEQNAKNSVLSTALYITILGAVIQILLGLLFSDWLSNYFFRTSNYSLMLKVMITASALGFVNTFFQTYFRLLNRSITVVIQGVIASLINFLIAIYLFQVTQMSILVPILSYLAGQVVIFVYSFIISKNQISLNFNKKEALLMVKFGLPTILVSFTMMAFEWSDRFFLNKYLTLAEVGIYSFAYKFGTLINPILIAPFAQIWNPLMMKYKDSDDIKSLTGKILTLYFGVGALFCLAACSFLDELILLFIKNVDYHKGTFLIPIIMASILIYGANNITNAGFLYKRKVTEISIICLIFAVISLVTNYLLIPALGYLGAAISTLLVYASLSLALYLRSHVYFKINPEYPKIVLFLLINFGIIYLNRVLNIEPISLRLSVKLLFISFSAIFTLYMILGQNAVFYFRNPKEIMNFLFHEGK